MLDVEVELAERAGAGAAGRLHHPALARRRHDLALDGRHVTLLGAHDCDTTNVVFELQQTLHT